MENNNQKILIIVVLSTILFLAVIFIGITYAFFTANNPEGSTAQIISENGRMLITYDDGTDSIVPVTGIVPNNAILVNKTFSLTGSNTTVGMSSNDGLDMLYNVGVEYISTFSDGMIHYYLKEIDRPTNSNVTTEYTGETDKTVLGNDNLTGYSHGTFKYGNRYTEMVSGKFPASLNDQTITFNLIIQFPDNNENQDSEKGKTINGRIIINKEFKTMTQSITELYANSDKDANGITIDGLQKDGTGAYNIQNVSTTNEKYNIKLLGNTSNNMIADTETDAYDNLRYVGANPNNYLSFNGETWRIIGTFNVYNVETNKYEKLVKIVRNDSLGEYSWDSSESTINSGWGINEWSQADLMTELNTDYISPSPTSETTKWYNGWKNTKNGTYDYSKNIKSSWVDKIANVRWNLGGYSIPLVSALNMYNSERGTAHISNPSDGITRTNTWNGKIALMYPSDYGYASTDTTCRGDLSSYDSNYNGYCKNENWLFNSANQWTLSPTSNDESSVFGVLSVGFVGSGSANFTSGVRPALFLKSDISIVDGTGTQNNPYIIATTTKSIGHEATFKDDSWAAIAKNIKSGNTSMYKLGDEKEVSIDGTDFTVRIANKSTPTECSKDDISQSACGFVIEFVDIVEDRPMNTDATNVGGWETSELRSYLNNEFLSKLPADLQNIITKTKVISGHGDKEEENFVTNDKIYLLSPHEVYPIDNFTPVDTDYLNTRQLDYYRDNNTTNNNNYSPAQKKYYKFDTGNLGWYWWYRSAYFSHSTTTTDFWNASNYGSVMTSNANKQTQVSATDFLYNGVAPAFRIG